MSGHLELRREGEIAWIVLNRPDKRNALSLAMWREIPTLVDEVENDPDIRVVVVRGADERAFSAGADISEFKTLRNAPEDARRYNEATKVAEHRLATLAKPTIAMIQGACVGGGCAIALCCDVRFADATARLGITPSNLGMVYPLPATKTLVDLVGPSRAKMLLFSGRQVGAQRALEIGLVDEVCAPDTVFDTTLEFARTVASRAQTSVRGTKRIIELILAGHVEDTDDSRQLHLDSFLTEDYREGVRAFLEKRRPRFQGR